MRYSDSKLTEMQFAVRMSFVPKPRQRHQVSLQTTATKLTKTPTSRGLDHREYIYRVMCSVHVYVHVRCQVPQPAYQLQQVTVTVSI